MPFRYLFLVLTLVASATGASRTFAATPGDAAAPAGAAKQQRLLAQKKAKQAALRTQQAALQKQKALAAAKAKQEAEKKKEWYADDRDHGLDIAHAYAPKTIDRIRAKGYIAKGDTVNTGNGKRGWRQYLDKYYSR